MRHWYVNEVPFVAVAVKVILASWQIVAGDGSLVITIDGFGLTVSVVGSEVLMHPQLFVTTQV